MSLRSLAIALLTTSTCLAQYCRQDISSFAPPANPDAFGSALSASEDRVLVGASTGQLNGPYGAPVFLREPVTGRLILETVLIPEDGLAGAFGRDVHLEGVVAVVGAPSSSTLTTTQCGAAYVYRRTGGVWTQEAKLTASDATAQDDFGRRVRVAGDQIAVSAPRRRLGLWSSVGAVYVFRRVGGSWVQTEIIEPNVPFDWSSYGSELDFDGVTLAMAGSRSPSYNNVAVLRRSPLFGTYFHEADLPGFLGGVVVLGDRLLTAHVFTPTGANAAVSTIRTFARDPATSTWSAAAPNVIGQGEGVGLDSDGVRMASAYGIGSPGRARIHRWNGAAWVAEQDIVAPGALLWTHTPLGPAIAVLGDHVIVSGREGALIGSPRLYDFDVTCDLVGSIYCQQTVANSTGRAGDLTLTGSDEVGANDLTAIASQLPENSFGFFLTSRTTDSVPNAGGSLGTLCLGGSIGRFVDPLQIQNAGALGAFSLALDLSSLPSPTGLVAAAVGETWHFQAWHRDVAQGPVSNFTDAVQVLLR